MNNKPVNNLDLLKSLQTETQCQKHFNEIIKKYFIRLTAKLDKVEENLNRLATVIEQDIDISSLKEYTDIHLNFVGSQNTNFYTCLGFTLINICTTFLILNFL